MDAYSYSSPVMGLPQILFIFALVLLFIYIVVVLWEVRFRQEPTGYTALVGSKFDIPNETFVSSASFAPLDYGMGYLGNLVLEDQRKNYPLDIKNQFVPSGHTMPLLREVQLAEPNSTATSGPTVDGTPNTPHSMFMFRYNKCSPDCCPGMYSCSGGCVCMSQNQRDFLASHGQGQNSH
jgi:hypothetical protein